MGDTAAQTGPGDASSRGLDDVESSEASGQIHLSQSEVEQVIARAVELQQDREFGRGSGLTLADLQAVVAQVGVDADLVRRALDEVRLLPAGSDEQGWTARVLGPTHVVGSAVVTGDADGVSRAIASWMSSEEGLLLAGTRDGADRWVPDNRLLTQVRHGMKVTRSESALRGLRGVTTRTGPAPDGTLVALEADTTPIRVANAAVLSVSGLVGIGAGVAAAVAFPDTAAVASDVLQFAAGFAVPAGAGAGITAIIHRSWLGRVRRAVVHALDGISMTSRDGHTTTSSASLNWRTLRQRWRDGN